MLVRTNRRCTITSMRALVFDADRLKLDIRNHCISVPFSQLKNVCYPASLRHVSDDDPRTEDIQYPSVMTTEEIMRTTLNTLLEDDRIIDSTVDEMFESSNEDEDDQEIFMSIDIHDVVNTNNK